MSAHATPLTPAQAHALVPPLRGCALCTHVCTQGADPHCAHPRVRTVQGLRPVQQARDVGGECGPGAEHLHIASWGAAA